jgi:predicted dehydrogenase
MFELGSHVIEIRVRLLGRPDEVTSVVAHHGRQTDELNDSTVAIFRYPRAIDIVHGATLRPKAGAHRRIEVRGTNGIIALGPIEPPAIHLDLARPVQDYAASRRNVPMLAYRRYVEDFRVFAKVIRGEQPLPETHKHQLAVQEALLKASGMA